MPSEDYSIKEVDGVTVLRINAENMLSVSEVSRVSAAVNAYVDKGVKKLVLDLKHVQYAGSAALGLMLSLREKMQHTGGKLVLSHVEHLDKLLTLSRTKGLFQIAPGPSEAIEMIK